MSILLEIGGARHRVGEVTRRLLVDLIACDMVSRRVLMVSYWYPPTPGAGAARAAGFSRHLPGFGWDPVVLAAAAGGSSLSARLFGYGESETTEQGAAVYRVPDLVGAGSIQKPYAGPPASKGKEHWLRRFVFPDRFAIWAGRAEREARYKLGEMAPDVVWTSFPPASAAMVACRLAARFGRPLVVDLRDPWFGMGGYAPRSARLRERHEALERRVMGRAAAITVISDAMRDDACRRLGIDSGRVHIVTNGFDLSQCVSAAGAAAERPRELVHVGSVTQRNRPDLFFEALAAKRRKGPLPCRVRFVGNLSADYISSLGLADSVSSTGMLAWADAWGELRRASALLLLVGEYVGKWGHNTKIFEYVRSGRPVLCLEERSGSNDRRLLEGLAADRAIFGSLNDPGAIVQGMIAVMQLGHNSAGRALDESEALCQYDRRRLAGQLAGILDAIVTRR